LPAGADGRVGDVIIGVPKEIKTDEYRVGMTPAGVELLVLAGHTVLIQSGAGVGSGIADEAYAKAGAKVVDSPDTVWGEAGMVVKVKEPLAAEYRHLRKGLTVFTYFHFAADEALTRACLDSGVTAVAYETIIDAKGTTPLLTPMSEVAGRMSIQQGAKYLEAPMMGRGILLGGVPGVAPANVLIIGAGVVGAQAAKIAAGFGANIHVLDVNLDRLRYLDDVLPPNVTCLMSNPATVRELLPLADLVIGAVLIPGARAPRLVTADDVRNRMRKGAVVIDVAVDQGGCIETIHPTTHSQPTYMVDGVVHYAVANMPGAVGRTSTYALTNATTPYTLQLAAKGWAKAAADNPAIASGVNIVDGLCVNKAVAAAWNLKFQPLKIG
jgi:alanine dehydrogenase